MVPMCGESLAQGILLAEGPMGAPYLARFSRDVGDHGPSPASLSLYLQKTSRFASPHLAKNEPRYGAPIGPRQGEVPGRISSPGKQATPVLPGGNGVPALVGGSVQHVDTPGVHMLGHLENSVEFVVQGRFASRTRQRIVTRSQSSFVCTHNEYWYTSAQAPRKCANHTITRPRRGQPSSPLEPTPGYLSGEAYNPPPAEDRYLQQNRWRMGRGPGLPKWLWLPSL